MEMTFLSLLQVILEKLELYLTQLKKQISISISQEFAFVKKHFRNLYINT